jgi:hypothetical protein
MSDASWDFNWNLEEVIQLSEEQLEAIMAEFALVTEGESKKELEKGHGVKTGTLRRSIHAASGEYEFGGDDVEPSTSSPERGGKQVQPMHDGHRFVAAVGSGLSYAMRIHQGWGKFGGYHYITNGLEKAKAQRDAIIERHQVK